MLCRSAAKGEVRMRDIFPKLFGNGQTKSRLGAAILDSRLPHALLIDGGEGSGKMTLAKSIAAALNCEHRGDERYSLPCHECSTCRRIFGDGYVDMHIIEPDGGRATIGIESVKDMKRDMYLTATEARTKVYIIKEAEKLTPAAQNALLISLEEPPADVLIMLLASGTDKILTTIKSRAQYVSMARFSPQEIGSYLLRDPEAAEIRQQDPDGFDTAMVAADGRIGLARALISPDRRGALAEEQAETRAIIASLGRGKSFIDIHNAISALPTKRTELSVSLERLILAIGDLIRIRYDASAQPTFYKSAEDAESVGGGINTKKLFRIYDIVSFAYDSNLKNANTSALLAALAAELKGA